MFRLTQHEIFVELNETYGSLPTPIYDGHSFLGWYHNETRIFSDSVVSCENNHTLTAHWQIRTHSVFVIVDQGVKAEWLTKEVVYGENVPTPEVWKTDYTFVGWANKPEKMPDHDVEITAKLIRTSYSICNPDIVSILNRSVLINWNNMSSVLNLLELKENGFNKLNVTILFTGAGVGCNELRVELWFRGESVILYEATIDGIIYREEGVDKSFTWEGLPIDKIKNDFTVEAALPNGTIWGHVSVINTTLIFTAYKE